MRRAALLLLFCAGFALAQVPTVGAPELHLEADNLTQVLRKLYTYQQLQYRREIVEVVKAAHDWVETRTAKVTPGEKLAAVFDIDETSLSNLPFMLDCGFCSSATQAKLYAGEHPPAIPAVRDLYDFARSKGIAMIFLTGRTEPARATTTADLQAAGYAGWTELLMRPAANTQTAAIMKANVRKSVEQRGYKIILSIGDQLSDLSGGAAERTYKLPNPFYFVE